MTLIVRVVRHESKQLTAMAEKLQIWLVLYEQFCDKVLASGFQPFSTHIYLGIQEYMAKCFKISVD